MEACCEDDDIELVEVFCCLNAGFGNAGDGFAIFDINQPHIVTVVGFVVTVIERGALGEKRVALGREEVCQLGVVDFFSDLAGNEVGGHLVRFSASEQVIESLEYPAETAIPMLLKNLLHLFRRGVDGVSSRRLFEGHAEHVITGFGNNLVVVVLDLFFPLRRHIFLHGGQNKIGRALKYGDLSRGLGDFRQHLDGGGACANNADSLSCDIESLWPARRMEDRSSEGIGARERGDHRL